MTEILHDSFFINKNSYFLKCNFKDTFLSDVANFLF